MSVQPPKRRHWFRRTGIVSGGLVAALVLTLGGGYVWLYGWTWKEAPEFHENWTVEERAALTGFDTCVQGIFHETLNELTAKTFTAMQLSDIAQLIIQTRIMCSDVREQLHHFARCGHARDERKVYVEEQYQRIGITPTIMAAGRGQLRAVEALVAHGANPNDVSKLEEKYYHPLELETPLTPILSGHFLGDAEIPWEERRKTADFLLANGADINGTKRSIGFACDMALMLSQPRDTRPWMWAIDHGKTVSVENFCTMLALEEAGELVERVLREKLVNLNDTSYERTALQSLLAPLQSRKEPAAMEELQLLEKRLDMLLEAGANPNLVPDEAAPPRPGEGEEAYQDRMLQFNGIRETPLEIVEHALQAPGSTEYHKLCERLLEKLHAAGRN
ncbi:MAG: hypothetical protein IKW48_02660 [Akkermansia sp.]|nr:hypothetical protein [Akkermansia sp.]